MAFHATFMLQDADCRGLLHWFSTHRNRQGTDWAARNVAAQKCSQSQ